MDFLSFLTQAADYFVGFAKTFAGLMAALIIFMVARCLPRRIRKYFSACATVVISFALFKNSIQQLTFCTVKATVVNATIACLTALTILFFVYVATYIAQSASVRSFSNARRDAKCDSRIVKSYALRNDDICASAAFCASRPSVYNEIILFAHCVFAPWRACSRAHIRNTRDIMPSNTFVGDLLCLK